MSFTRKTVIVLGGEPASTTIHRKGDSVWIQAWNADAESEESMAVLIPPGLFPAVRAAMGAAEASPQKAV